MDAIIVLRDGVSREDRDRLLDQVTRLEVSLGLRAPATRQKTALETFVERMGNALSFFICTRSELLAGDVAGVFGSRPPEALLRTAWDNKFPLTVVRGG